LKWSVQRWLRGSKKRVSEPSGPTEPRSLPLNRLQVKQEYAKFESAVSEPNSIHNGRTPGQ
jgi:hypothetical protein